MVTYLNRTIYAIRRRWAFCFRLGILTLGINSTQRCEGYFAKLKAELEKMGTLCSLNTSISRITARYSAEDQLYMEASTRALDVAVKGIDAGLRSIYGALLEVAKHHGTLHCLKHIAQEVVAAARYHVAVADEGLNSSPGTFSCEDHHAHVAHAPGDLTVPLLNNDLLPPHSRRPLSLCETTGVIAKS